ncbi:MAG: hypothetical protein LBM99_01545 [Bacillales bacterium]|jgi:hypothetical protein|nr:hypothetical protein [Bacillales bacterium]
MKINIGNEYKLGNYRDFKFKVKYDGHKYLLSINHSEVENDITYDYIRLLRKSFFKRKVFDIRTSELLDYKLDLTRSVLLLTTKNTLFALYFEIDDKEKAETVENYLNWYQQKRIQDKIDNTVKKVEGKINQVKETIVSQIKEVSEKIKDSLTDTKKDVKDE